MRKLKWWEKPAVASAVVIGLISAGCFAAPDNDKGEDCNSGLCVKPGENCDRVGADGTYHDVWYICTSTAKDGNQWVKEDPQPPK